MLPDYDVIVAARHTRPRPIELGRSRDGHAIEGFRFGAGPVKVSLIAGCHADEPVGPRLLRRVVGYLAGLDGGSDLLSRYQWWIVPHINPDGAARNSAWSQGVEDRFDLTTYLGTVVRELPGDDIEFGFPRDHDDEGARPENRAVFEWWANDPTPFALHASLHGMAVAGGPWFLVEPAWADRCARVKESCSAETRRLGYALHDVERHGEKGFRRIERGFCTRPDSKAMSQHFLDLGDPGMAARFRPSSMETIRSHGGDPLTLVSEIPLFIIPGVGEIIEPRDPVADEWRGRLAGWKERIRAGDVGVAAEIGSSGVIAVPIEHQMRLQWAMIRAGIEQVDC